MNSLKPLLIAAVLAGIGYGVYVRINGGNDAPPPGAPESWDAAPKVEMTESGAGSGWPGPPGAPGASSPFGSPKRNAASGPAGSGSEAPRYTPPAGDNAPPYATNGGAPSAGADQAMAPPAQQPPAEAPAGDPYHQAPPTDVAVTAPSAGGASPESGDRGAAPAYNGTPDRYGTQAEQPAGPPEASVGNALATTMDGARRELESGQLAQALMHLSALYDDPRVPAPEQQQLNQLLDQVAGTVVYSTQHLLEPPYEVQPNERLEDIGQKYNVPWELLAKINGIEDPASLRPGERLKVVRGPFSALVSLDKRQLTLLLANGSYAGRFNIGIGREHPPREGVFSVSDKVLNPVYHGPDRAVGANDQSNPLGKRWIGLGSELGIHGTNHPENIGRTDLPGSISLSPRDAEDVYDILSVGSKVIIRR